MKLATVPTLADVRRWESLSPAAVQADAEAAGIVDGLPFAPISCAAVEQALAAIGAAAEDVIASLPPLRKPATAEALAICATLAGCPAELMPVVLAAAQAVSAEVFDGFGVLTTTGGTAIAVVVSGPMAQLFNSGANLLGPGNRANATVGRALALATRVIGGSVPALTDMATMGQPGKYTFCFAEKADGHPWQPVHVARGVPAEQSAVTVFAASGTVEVANAHVNSADDVLDSLAASLYQPGSLDFQNGLVGGGCALILISPEWVTMLTAEGLSRDAVSKELSRRATWDADVLPPGLRRPVLSELAARDGQPVIRAADTPQDLQLVVAGGVGMKQAILPGWGGPSRPVTRRIATASDQQPMSH